jgi:type II secretory pathway pseudopilin PulG
MNGSEKKLGARPGMTLLETTVALLVVSAVIAAIVQLVSVTANQRRTLEERRLALQEVANQAERIALLSWEQTDPEKLTLWQPSADLLAAAPQAKCLITVSSEPGSPDGRHIRLSITENSAADAPIELAAVTLWKFPPAHSP